MGPLFFWGSGSVETIFTIRTDGTGITNLFKIPITGAGDNRAGGLTVAGNTLYGTTYSGGTYGSGTVFRLNADGSGFTMLHSFSAISTNILPTGTYTTNTDGSGPMGELVLARNTLYGTTSLDGPAHGGFTGLGTVFKVNTDGSDFTTLHSFYNDGGYASGLLLSDGTLYGVTEIGGGSGTVFKVNTDGIGYALLHSFGSDYALLPSLSASGDSLGGPLVLGGWLCQQGRILSNGWVDAIWRHTLRGGTTWRHLGQWSGL